MSICIHFLSVRYLQFFKTDMTMTMIMMPSSVEVAKFIVIAFLLVLCCSYFYLKDSNSSLPTLNVRSLTSTDVERFRRSNKTSHLHRQPFLSSRKVL